MPGMTQPTIAPQTLLSTSAQASLRCPRIERLLEAARCGDAQAYYELGSAYALGEGVDIDLIEAHRWYNLAALAGVKSAQAERAALAADMAPTEIAEAQRLAREWIAALGH